MESQVLDMIGAGCVLLPDGELFQLTFQEIMSFIDTVL